MHRTWLYIVVYLHILHMLFENFLSMSSLQFIAILNFPLQEWNTDLPWNNSFLWLRLITSKVRTKFFYPFSRIINVFVQTRLRAHAENWVVYEYVSSLSLYSCFSHTLWKSKALYDTTRHQTQSHDIIMKNFTGGLNQMVCSVLFKVTFSQFFFRRYSAFFFPCQPDLKIDTCLWIQSSVVRQH